MSHAAPDLYVDPSLTPAQLTQSIAAPVEARPPRWWMIGAAGAASLALLFVGSVGWLIWKGVGVWGLGSPAFWGFDIINMVFWVGIAHTGTAVTAFMTLSRQAWKNGINRIAEAMTIFAVMCAALFPLIHVGRPWMAYAFMPVPNAMGIWPNFKSPIFADFFALNTYLYVSALFWYLGMLPDLAALRDRAKNKIAFWAYGLLALGWRGSARQWNHYQKAYLLMAAIGTPLVLSVCAIVSMTFAPSIIPGWHATIFPLYFLTGALAAGFSMLGMLAVFTRSFFGFKHLITEKHLETINKWTLACILGVAYVYLVEFFIAWYSGNIYERFTIIQNRLGGPYAAIYWTMLACNVLIPQLFWFKKFRTRQNLMVFVCLAITVGMWCERFVILVLSIHRDFLPGSWGMYAPSLVEVATFLGTIGVFLTMFLAFLKFLPAISMAEIKHQLPSSHPGHTP